MPYFYVLTASLLFITGNFLFKTWALREKFWILGVGLLLFLVGNVLRAFAIKEASLSVVVPIVLLINLIASLLVAYFYFHEELSASQYFGLFFATIAIILLIFPLQIFGK